MIDHSFPDGTVAYITYREGDNVFSDMAQFWIDDDGDIETACWSFFGSNVAVYPELVVSVEPYGIVGENGRLSLLKPDTSGAG